MDARKNRSHSRRERPRDTSLLRLEGHGRPVSRRDFLSRGLIGGVGMVMMPSLSSLISNPAFGAPASCGGPLGGAGKIPFICFDLAGGASIAGSNVLVGGTGGQLDLLDQAGYIKLGLPATMQPSDPAFVDRLDPAQTTGITFHSTSALLRGIRLRAQPSTLAQVEGCVVCARSENDTQNNPHNPMFGIAAAGADGELVTLIGTNNSDSGGRSVAPMSMYDPAIRPTRIARPSDATGLVDTGKLVQMLGQNDAGAVMSAIEEISRLKLGAVDEDQLVEDLVECGYIQSSDLVAQFGSPDALDPTQDALLTTIFSAAEIGARDEYRKTASVMKMIVSGFAGAGTIEFGGYDYHNSTRATGERKDEMAGECIGAVLEYAALMQQQLMVYVFSDGSVASDGQIDTSVDGGDKGIWKGDNSSTASVFMLAYNPPIIGAPPQLTPQIIDHQIGYFRSSGSVELAATPVSNQVELLSKMVALNYMALHDEQDQFDVRIPNSGLPPMGAARDALIAFQPIR